jgi:hypothetical protein
MYPFYFLLYTLYIHPPSPILFSIFSFMTIAYQAIGAPPLLVRTRRLCAAFEIRGDSSFFVGRFQAKRAKADAISCAEDDISV